MGIRKEVVFLIIKNKKMKKPLIASLAILLSTSCTGRQDTGTQGIYPSQGEQSKNHEMEKVTTTNQWERLIMMPFKNDQGTVIVEMPFPPSWEFHRRHEHGSPHITGPNNTRVIDYPSRSFVYSHSPQLQQVYWQNGKPMRPVPSSIDELIQQDFVPWGDQNGLRFVRHYEIPEIAQIDNWYDDQLFKVAPPRKQINAYGTEWVRDNGDPFFLLIRFNETEMLETISWSYFCTSLEAERDHYERAKQQLVFGIANAHYNPGPIMDFNRAEAERANQSWAAFNRRMAENQAAFQAQQRDFVNRSNAINESIMSGWRAQNEANDIAHERFVDAIAERTNTVNTATGTYQKVESGYNQYWMNSDGKYISTHSHSYDPNLDEALNSRNWDNLKEINR